MSMEGRGGVREGGRRGAGPDARWWLPCPALSRSAPGSGPPSSNRLQRPPQGAAGGPRPRQAHAPGGGAAV